MLDKFSNKFCGFYRVKNYQTSKKQKELVEGIMNEGLHLHPKNERIGMVERTPDGD